MSKETAVVEEVKREVRCRRCRGLIPMLYVDAEGRLWAMGLMGNVRISGYTCPRCERNFSWGVRKK